MSGVHSLNSEGYVVSGVHSLNSEGYVVSGLWSPQPE